MPVILLRPARPAGTVPPDIESLSHKEATP